MRAAQESADLLALGLVTAPFDALAASEESDVVGTLGWYDDDREEMVVRGTDVDDTEVQLTVVHELTHALQDQHFDLPHLDERADTSGEQAALGALIEGDATLVEHEYLWSLPQRVQDTYWGDVERAWSRTPAASRRPRVTSRRLAPRVRHVVGVRLRPGAGRARSGHRRARPQAGRRLFRSPPRSEEAIMDPVGARGTRSAEAGDAADLRRRRGGSR